jgi:hypothetical protein
MNPYHPETFVDLWHQESGQRMSTSSVKTHAAYPLPTLVVVAPLAALSWLHFEAALTILTLLLTAAMTCALVATAHLEGMSRWLFILAVLALAPIHTAIATGNVVVVAVAVACIGTYLAEKGRNIGSGLCIALALCLKPQIGGVFLLYYLLRRRWKVSVAALAITAVITLIGAARLSPYGTGWIHDFLANSCDFVAANPIDDFTTENPLRFTLINLQVPVFDFTGNRNVSDAVALLTCAVLGIAWLLLFRQRADLAAVRFDLHALGCLATLSLLPVYHRFYDATLLVLPLCWALASKAPRSRTGKILFWTLLIPFLFPGAAFLQQMASAGKVPSWIQGKWWWSGVVMPHEVWALLLLVLLLLWEMHAIARTSGDQALSAAARA